MRALLILALLAALALGAAACSEDEPGATGSPETAGNATEPGGSEGGGGEPDGEAEPDGETPTVAVLAPTLDSAVAAALERELAGRVEPAVVGGVRPEQAAQAVADAAAGGARLVVDEAGLGEAFLEACAATPAVGCLAVGPAATEPPANVALLVPAAWQVYYALGAAAGELSRTATTAFVARTRAPEEIAAVNAWALGCQTVDPNCVTRVAWLDEEDAGPARLARSLARSADVVGSTVDDPRLCRVGTRGEPWLAAGPQTAMACPDRVFATPGADLAALAVAEVESQLDGSWTGGRSQVVGVGDGAEVEVAADAPQRVEAAVGRALEQLASGESPFAGPLFDNQGTERVAEGETLGEDVLSSGWDWLLGGVLE